MIKWVVALKDMKRREEQVEMSFGIQVSDQIVKGLECQEGILKQSRTFKYLRLVGITSY